MVTFSCITPCYREGPLLARAIASLLAQWHGDFELILVDDGADPATRAVAAGIDDPRLRVIRQANDGLSCARNRGIAAARGDYICFLDADDTRPPWALSALAEVIARDAPDLILSQGHLQEDTGQKLPFYDREALDLLGHHLGPRAAGPDDATARMLALLAEPQSANKCIRRDLLQRSGLSFPNGHFFEDLYFHALAIAASERLSLCDHPTFTYHRRVSGSQLTGGRDMMRFDILAVLRLLTERIAPLPLAADPGCRTALLLSAAKLVRWCEEMLPHPHRAQFRTAFLAVLALADPQLRAPLAPMPALPWIPAVQDWLTPFLTDPRLDPLQDPPHPQPTAEETRLAPEPFGLPRLWQKRRA